MSGIESTGERQAVYDENGTALAAMVAASDAHAVAHPNCPANPLCIGGVQAAQVDVLTKDHPELAFFLIIVAVLELSRAGKREAALTQRLDLQRGIAADASRRVLQLEDEVQSLLARLDAAEHLERVIQP